MFWTLHIAFLLFFMNVYFPKNLFKHQIYPMIFVIIYGIICRIIITFLILEDDKNIYQINGIYLSIFIILFYIFIAMLFSFSQVKIKVLKSL